MNEAATQKRTLTDLARELREICWRIDELDGELDADIEEQLDATEAALEEKVERVLGVADDYEAKAGVFSERAKRFSAKACALGNQAKRLRAYVLRSMQEAEITRMSTDSYPAVTVRKTPPAVEVDAVIFLPWAEETGAENYLRRKDPTPNKTEIKAALKGGTEVPGCELVQGVRLAY